MAFVHIKSKIPAIVYIDGKPIGEINKRNHFCLDVESPNSFLLFALPFSKSTPITCALNLTACHKKEEELSIIPFYGNHFDVLLNFSQSIIQMPIKELAYFSTKDKKIRVYDCGTCYLCAYIDGSLKTNVKIGEGYTKARIENVNDFNCIIAEKDDDTKHAVILDSEFNIQFNDDIELMENNSDYISLLSPQNDLFGHSKVTRIGKTTESYFVYENNHPKYLPLSLSALGLLQCVKVGNLSQCQGLLSETLSDKANNLTSYFGNLKNIYYNSYITDKQNYTIETEKEFKSFSFVTDNGRIKEIIEEDFKMETESDKMKKI